MKFRKHYLVETPKKEIVIEPIEIEKNSLDTLDLFGDDEKEMIEESIKKTVKESIKEVIEEDISEEINNSLIDEDVIEEDILEEIIEEDEIIDSLIDEDEDVIEESNDTDIVNSVVNKLKSDSNFINSVKGKDGKSGGRSGWTGMGSGLGFEDLRFVTEPIQENITSIETQLGSNLSGSMTDLSTRLDVSINSEGKIRQPYYPLQRPRSLDLSATNTNLKNFYGGFTDGDYGYLVPKFNAAGVPHGLFARINLADFSTVDVLNLETSSANLVGFSGGFSDGRYGYLVPAIASKSGTVGRVDLQDFSTVESLSLLEVGSTLKVFESGFADSEYCYLVPSTVPGIGAVGNFVRIDQQNFTSAGVTVLDLTVADPDLKGFKGGFTDGRYGYLAPFDLGTIVSHNYSGKIARVDLDDFTTSAVTSLDLTLVDPDLKGFRGGFTDGKYGYFIPFENGNAKFLKIARVDLDNFTTSGVTVLDLESFTEGLYGLNGITTACTDGLYGYFCSYDGYVVRIDLQDFSTVVIKDLLLTEDKLSGYYGSFTDGKNVYLVPNSTTKVAKISIGFGGKYKNTF